MIRRSGLPCALLVFLQFLSLCMATQQRADDKAKQEPKLDGTWKLVEWKMNGEVNSLPDDQAVQMTIMGDSFQMKRGDKVYDEGTLSVNRDVTPKAIDIKHVDEKLFQGKINLGIYEFKRQDELWMAISRAGKANRPVDFTSAKGTDHAVYWFRRQ